MHEIFKDISVKILDLRCFESIKSKHIAAYTPTSKQKTSISSKPI